jgi:hypothetical protein
MRRLFPSLLLLTALGCEGSNEVTAPPAPSIHGTVTSTRNLPSDVAVHATKDSGEVWSTHANRNTGDYRFWSLPPGEFEVAASGGYRCVGLRESVTVPTVEPVHITLWCE